MSSISGLRVLKKRILTVGSHTEIKVIKTKLRPNLE